MLITLAYYFICGITLVVPPNQKVNMSLPVLSWVQLGKIVPEPNTKNNGYIPYLVTTWCHYILYFSTIYIQTKLVSRMFLHDLLLGH